MSGSVTCTDVEVPPMPTGIILRLGWTCPQPGLGFGFGLGTPQRDHGGNTGNTGYYGIRSCIVSLNLDEDVGSGGPSHRSIQLTKLGVTLRW